LKSRKVKENRLTQAGAYVAEAGRIYAAARYAVYIHTAWLCPKVDGACS
jgi:hypothetical protein